MVRQEIVRLWRLVRWRRFDLDYDRDGDGEGLVSYQDVILDG